MSGCFIFSNQKLTGGWRERQRVKLKFGLVMRVVFTSILIMYGWQEKGVDSSKKVFLPAQRSKAINVLGFMRTNNEGECHEFSQVMDTSIFIACVNSFIEKRAKGKKILLILDRATPHKNARVEQEIKKWKEKNVFVQFLPATVQNSIILRYFGNI